MNLTPQDIGFIRTAITHVLLGGKQKPGAHLQIQIVTQVNEIMNIILKRALNEALDEYRASSLHSDSETVREAIGAEPPPLGTLTLDEDKCPDCLGTNVSEISAGEVTPCVNPLCKDGFIHKTVGVSADMSELPDCFKPGLSRNGCMNVYEEVCGRHCSLIKSTYHVPDEGGSEIPARYFSGIGGLSEEDLTFIKELFITTIIDRIGPNRIRLGSEVAEKELYKQIGRSKAEQVHKLDGKSMETKVDINKAEMVELLKRFITYCDDARKDLSERDNPISDTIALLQTISGERGEENARLG